MGGQEAGSNQRVKGEEETMVSKERWAGKGQEGG